jgi:hypothetical protein
VSFTARQLSQAWCDALDDLKDDQLTHISGEGLARRMQLYLWNRFTRCIVCGRLPHACRWGRQKARARRPKVSWRIEIDELARILKKR